jgi:flagellar motor switch protein FliG
VLDDTTDIDMERPEPGQVAPVLDGGLSAAILLMLLDDSDAAAILKYLDPTEVKSLGKAMFEASNATEGDVELALEQFVSSNRDVSSLAVGAPVRIRGMMNEALGNVRADNILAEIAPVSSAPSLDILRWMDVPTLGHLIATEHPQVAAIILSVLTPEVAAQALAGLDEQAQVDLLYRSARLKTVPAEAIEDLEAILALFSHQQAAAPDIKLGGQNDVARIVNNLSRPLGEKLLRSLRKKDRQLADAIEEEMFVFDNLADLDAKSLGAVLRNVEAAQLALAIKGAGTALAAKMLDTLSSRAAQTITDEIAEMGPVKRDEVEAAQKAVIAIARQMAASGEIMLGGKSDDYV